jgi:hypothetical protein
MQDRCKLICVHYKEASSAASYGQRYDGRIIRLLYKGGGGKRKIHALSCKNKCITYSQSTDISRVTL